MRLTLRTLLAYMDDMLDPSDQEELGRKIEASPFATELIHRSRDAVRRLRLSAPDPLAGASGDLHGGDHNLDANTAAEYLDSILSPDDVAEFERSCLEAGNNADMLLAEAVSCHHILTLVLGEPAEVDADLRQRMYEIVAHSAAAPEPQQVRVEPAHVSPAATSPPTAVPPAPAPAAATSRPRRMDVEPDEGGVPDYIREAARARRMQRRALAAVGLAAIAGGVATWWIMTSGEAKVPQDVAAAAGGVDADNLQIEMGGDVATSSSATSDAATDEASAGTDGDDAPAWTPPAATGDAPPFEGAASDAPLDDAPPFSATPPAGDVGAEASPPAAGADSPAEDLDAEAAPPADAGAIAAVEPDADAAVGVPPVVELPGEVPAGATVDAGAPPPLPVPTDAPMVDAGATAPTTPIDPLAIPDPEDLAAASATAAADAAASDAAADEPAAPRQLANYFGNNDLLLQYDPTTSAWLRLPPRSALSAGARLLVLPGFRTHVALDAGVNAFLGGGTEVVVMTAAEAAADATADFGLAVPFGRVILNSGASGNRIALVVGDHVRVIELGPSSSLGLDVQRLFVPGTDPERETYPLQVTWYLTTGSVAWDDESAGVSAEGQATWTTLDGIDEAPQSIDELPDWLNAEQLTGLEESARDVIAKELVAGQAVSIPLLELTDAARLGRRAEVRTLAARAGAYVGQFDPLVSALSDMNERPRWAERVETLRQAVARDPASLELIAKSFATQRGQDATGHLVEMLLGYNSEDVGATKAEIANGALVRLITWLDSEDLSYRVLASYNVKEITGTALGGYRPEHAAKKRESEIRFYWDRLEKGELTPRAWLATGWAPR